MFRRSTNPRQMTENQFRKMALSLPGAVESAHMNHPDFRAEGKIFATLGYPGDEWGMVKLTPAHQRAFIKKAAGALRPCKGVWGERGATNVHLESVTKKLLKSALEAARENAISLAKSKSS